MSTAGGFPVPGRCGGLLTGTMVLVLLVGIGGCAVNAPRSTPPPEPEGPTESMTEEELAELFVDRARQLIDQARPAQAESYLDRAMSLRPENPGVWYQLARVRREQGRLRQADVLAHKSLDLVEEDRRLKIDVWRLLADVRYRMGNREGARRARERADRLEGGW